VALNDPLFYFGTLASPNSLRFLNFLLQKVCENLGLTEPPADFPLDDISIHPTRVGDFPCAVVELPRPVAQPEAFFTAAVLLTPLDGENPPEKLEVRYFTLEQSFEFDGAPFAMMCEWTNEMHCNFGGGPPPRLDAFLAAVERLIQRNGEKAAQE
jgi:hypothetical protein